MSISLLAIAYHLYTFLIEPKQSVKDTNAGINSTFVNINAIIEPVSRNVNSGNSLCRAITQRN